MTPDQFISKWKAAELKERSAAQSHFIDLCRVLDEPAPTDVDSTGSWYAFERGATKTTGGEGWADVWKRGHFGWEYKGKRKDLNAAFAQLQQYALALENPPLLVVCDLDRFRIHTNWTNSVSEIHEFSLDDLRDSNIRQKLKWVLSDPDRLKPGKTRQALTEEAAAEFAKLAQRLRERGHPSEQVAHFVNRLVFCMFAEDVDLLPNKMFKRMLNHAQTEPQDFLALASDLFKAMNTGGRVGFEHVQWFNGGLFDDGLALPLDSEDIGLVLKAARLDWAEVDPSILGTLFERGLDPDKRSQLGAHYTNREKIMMIIDPIISRPLLAKWEETKSAIVAQLNIVAEAQERKPAKQSDAKRVYMSARRAEETARKRGYKLFIDYLDYLKGFVVLDPACGSGNFLYLALLTLKEIEHRANIEAELLGFTRQAPSVGPETMLGIEINPYAAELARVSVWIGEIQWMRRNGFSVSSNPILKPLNTIEQRNAIVSSDGSAAAWPRANVVIGNPPYLGAKLMKRKMGVEQTDAIRQIYFGRLPNFTDLVCYWFENARQMIEEGSLERAGLVATNSIRKNTNLTVMQRIVSSTQIFDAWSEERWTLDGAAVDVSLICFGEGGGQITHLNGELVNGIHADLTTGINMTLAGPLAENRNAAFIGIQKSGPFDIKGDLARAWMREPSNPNNIANSEILKPYWNGDDVTGRPRDVWFIDLPLGLSKAEAALFATPFRHLATTPDDDGKLVQELRTASGSSSETYPWWQPWRPRPELRSRIERLDRYLVTPETAQHRIFVWLSYPILPDKNLIVIPREDDLMFGLLQNRFHELWSLRKGSDLQDRPRYTLTTTFATYPFPVGMTPDLSIERQRSHAGAAAIESAARQLNLLRHSYLFPDGLVTSVPEVINGFPDRIIPVDDAASRTLTSRTLTALYNEMPTWLVEAHRTLDAAVAEAYGWPSDISNDEALNALFEMNQTRKLQENELMGLL